MITLEQRRNATVSVMVAASLVVGFYVLNTKEGAKGYDLGVELPVRATDPYIAPEPSTGVLMILGGIGLSLRRSRQG